jgi:hypothetical protein
LWPRGKVFFFIDFPRQRGRINLDLLGELDRLRDPEIDSRDDPSNLLDNSSGGKQIKKVPRPPVTVDRRLFLLGKRISNLRVFAR